VNDNRDLVRGARCERRFGRSRFSPKWRAISAASVFAVTALSACGGSSAKKVDPAADLAAAKAAVLTAADLPGYTPKPHSESNDLPASAKQQFAKCLNTSTTLFDTTPGAQKANSPDFDKDQAEVQSSIEIDPTRADITKGWNEITQRGLEDCLGKLFDAALKGSVPGATFGATEVTRFEPHIGNQSVGYQMTIPATSQAGQQLRLYIDVIFVPRDRAGITLSGLNLDQPVDRATEIALAQKIYDRVGTHAQ
jgi:hypothetical protein